MSDERYWPLADSPVPGAEIPAFNAYYLDLYDPHCDPGMTWGTDVDMTGVEQLLKDRNRESDVILSPAHVLVQAVGRALKQHPAMNRRVVRRQLYEFRGTNVLMPFRNPHDGQADVMLIKDAGTRPLNEIAAEMWRYHQEAAAGQFRYRKERETYRRFPKLLSAALLRLRVGVVNATNRQARLFNERMRSSPVAVNYLAFRGAPPMRSFQASRLPLNSYTLNVTMGPTERKPVVVGSETTIRPIAPLFVRGDHRVCDAFELGTFVATLRNLLAQPGQMDVEKSF